MHQAFATESITIQDQILCRHYFPDPGASVRGVDVRLSVAFSAAKYGEMVLQGICSGTGLLGKHDRFAYVWIIYGVSTCFFRGLVGAVAMTRRSRRSVRADSPLGTHPFALKILWGSELQNDNRSS